MNPSHQGLREYRVLSVGVWLSVFVVLLPLGCGAPTAPGRADTDAQNRITVLGDSLAISPSLDDAFPAVLADRIEEAGLPWTVTNAGVSGDTTADGLRRLDLALRDRPDILILALGANDGLRGVETSTVSRNLDEIIMRAKARGTRVLLCGMEAPPLRGLLYTVAFHNIYPALAERHDLPLVPFLLAGVFLNPEMNAEDLVHPNAAGAIRIADSIWPYLQPMLQGAGS